MAIDLSRQFNAPNDANEFEQWFNGSKVVDPNGEPLVVFHGTTECFKVSAFMPLSHFGSAVVANTRVPVLNELQFSASPKIYPVSLNIKNPLEINDITSHNFENYKNLIWSLGLNKTIAEHHVTECFGDWDQQYNYADKNGKHWTRLMIECLQGYGYDGFVYKNRMEDSGSTSYIIFESDQVRPAIPLLNQQKNTKLYLSKTKTSPLP